MTSIKYLGVHVAEILALDQHVLRALVGAYGENDSMKRAIDVLRFMT